MDTLIAPLISALKENHASVNDAEVTRAFEVARDAHEGQLPVSYTHLTLPTSDLV